jgi:hypothetical protein
VLPEQEQVDLRLRSRHVDPRRQRAAGSLGLRSVIRLRCGRRARTVGNARRRRECTSWVGFSWLSSAAR